MSALKNSPSITQSKLNRAQKIYQLLRRLFPRTQTALHYGNPWELMIAVILSAQCTDKKVNEVTKRLFKKYRTLDDYIDAKPRYLESVIYSTGFYRTKALHIRAAARLIKERFGGRVPRSMRELLTLPGVARKTANVVLGAAYGIAEGIAVDTHVIRLSNRLGLSKHKDPRKIEQDLMSLFPRRQWMSISDLLIAYGRAYCTATNADHSGCPLSAYEHR